MSDRLDLDGAARLLGTPRATLERWVRQGLLRPAASPFGGVAFARAELEAWARRRGLRLAERERAPSAPAADMLADAIERGAYRRDVRAATAREAIEEAAAALERGPAALDAAACATLAERVLDRERLASTGLGHGVAVPHPRTPPADLVTAPLVSVVLLAEPVDWAALDGEPVHAAFLLVSPGAAEHLELLARVARVMRDPELPAELARRPRRDELLERLRDLRRDG